MSATALSKQDLRRHLEVAAGAAEAAAGVIRGAGEISESAIREKGTNDLVTAVDRLAEETILEFLAVRFPDYEVLAEESAHGADVQAAPSGFRWIVDPLDGTTNFTRGLAPYAVSIALEHTGGLLVGVVLNVATGELFTAAAGLGFMVDGVRARVSGTESLGGALVTTGFPYRSFEKLDAYMATLRTLMLKTRGVRRPGSASIDLAHVASGKFDIFFEYGLAPWDVAAGTVLIREAGGIVTDFGGGADVVYSEQILATNGALHDEMLALVTDMR